MTVLPQPALLSRRRFLRSGLAITGLMAGSSLLTACQQAAPAPTAAPAKPTEAPKAAAPAPAPAPAAKPAASPAAAPAAAAPAASPAVAKPAVTGTLKLGVLLPYTKVYAALGESITNAMELYFDQNGGAAGGRKVEMIKEDEEADPQVGLRKVRKLVEQDQVDLLTGVVSSAVALALRDYVDQSKTIFLISNAGANALTRDRMSPYIFRTSFSNAQPNYPMGEWVYKNHAKKVMIAAADYAAGKEATGAFKETFTAAGGQIVAEIFPPFQNTDYAPFLSQIAERKPELVYTFFAGTDASNFVKQFDEFGLKKDIKLAGGGFLVEQDVLPAQGNAALGVLSGLHYSNLLDNAENKKFVADYKARFNKSADVYAMQGYDTARVIAEALKQTRGDTSNKEALIKAIEGISFASPRGPFAFDPATHNPIQNIYGREVKEVEGQLANAVLATFEKVKDPGK